MKEMTKREMIGLLLEMNEVKANDVIVEKLNHELELLDKKSTRTPSKATIEANSKLTALVLEAFKSVTEPVTTSELMKVSSELKDYTSQKITSIIKNLVESGEVIKNKVNSKKTTYILKEEED